MSNQDKCRFLPLRPDTFDGTGPIENFLTKFDLFAEYHDWSEREKSVLLKCSLEKGPLQLLWEFNSKADVTFDELVKKM